MIRWDELKKGDRVEIVALQDDPNPIPVGTVGEVISAGRLQVLVAWEHPTALNGLALPEDAHCAKKVG